MCVPYCLWDAFRRSSVCPCYGGRDAVFIWVIFIMPDPLWSSYWNDGLAGSSALAEFKRKMKLMWKRSK